MYASVAVNNRICIIAIPVIVRSGTNASGFRSVITVSARAYITAIVAL
jgi:hypothetical protein